MPAIAQLIKLHRFVTICGPDGMGKTTLALAVTHHLATHFEGLVLFQDMSSITDPALLPGMLASALGIRYRGMDPLHELMAFSQEQRLLLVLDSGDHIIVAATYLAEKLYGETEHVHILMTSREPLRAEGEHVHRLCPLTCPPEMCGLTATDALTFSAVRLLVERVHNNDNEFILSDNDAPMVAHFCRGADSAAQALCHVWIQRQDQRCHHQYQQTQQTKQRPAFVTRSLDFHSKTLEKIYWIGRLPSSARDRCTQGHKLFC